MSRRSPYESKKPQRHNQEVASDDSSGGWFNDIKILAKSTKDTILPAIDGIASIIHRSAMTVAAEIAQLERDAEIEAERWRAENYGTNNHTRTHLPLPWELPSKDSSMLLEDGALKTKILELATHEATFLGPFQNGDGNDFPLTGPLVELIRRLVRTDENLFAMHTKLTGGENKKTQSLGTRFHADTVAKGRSVVTETIFWKNYFHHCEEARREHMQGVPEDESLKSSLGSLIPVDGTPAPSVGDDASYVCVVKTIASPPSSLNTVTDTISVGDMVLVGADGSDLQPLDLQQGNS